jgi:flagellar biosynthesis/type III secretory pathway M-ring protein FliF/YscJ
MGVQDRDWYWKERDKKERAAYGDELGSDVTQFPRRHQSRSMHPVTMAALSLLGAVLLYAMIASFMQWRAQRMVDQVTRAGQESIRQSQLQAEQMQREASEREAQRQVELRQQEALRVQAISERHQVEEEAQRAAAEGVDRKAKAWAKFYRKPASCNDAATMECANSFIRAKRTFEERYARGEL